MRLLYDVVAGKLKRDGEKAAQAKVAVRSKRLGRSSVIGRWAAPNARRFAQAERVTRHDLADSASL